MGMVLLLLSFAAVGALIGWIACTTRYERRELQEMERESDD